MTFDCDQNCDRAMTPEQFTQVIEAILDGKYSWACVLILRFAGYNPLHYIPYRTYNRLIKDNGTKRQARPCRRKSPTSREMLQPIHDLNYIEPLNKHSSSIVGGTSYAIPISGPRKLKTSLKAFSNSHLETLFVRFDA